MAVRFKFNRLVKDLKKQGLLNEDHLDLTRAHLRNVNKSNFWFFLFFGIPPLLLFINYTYLYSRS